MVCEGWEGLTVDGKFPLLEWLGGWGDRCVFLTVGQATHPVNIKLIQASGNDADAIVAKWESAREIPHPCLLQLMETGRYRIRDTDIAYVVTEKADSFLSGLIPQRTLSAEQMKETLGPVVDALAFLHESGFVHGSVKPSSIVLINTQWKLSPDEMSRRGEAVRLGCDLDTYDAPEMGAGAVNSAADMWSLGIIMVEACSQRTPVWDRNAAGDLGVPDWLPEPFREIARGCLRWDASARITAAEARVLLAQMPLTSSAELPPKAKDVVVKEPTVEPRPVVSTLAERVAEVRTAAGDELHPRVAPFTSPSTSVSDRRIEPELNELTPRSRLFSNLAEEEEEPSRTGPVLFGLLVLLVLGVVLGVRYRDRLMPFIQRHSSPAPTHTPTTTEAPPTQATAPAPTPPTTAQSQPQTATVPSSSANEGISTPQNPPTQPATQPSETPKTPEPSAESASTPESQTASPEAAPKKEEASKPEKAAQSPRVMNAKGAVATRVVPNVAPGARESMRRPVQVDVRVAVDEDGHVTSAECMTQRTGNYFARISQQAARSWKFKPPISGGEARTSQWMLLFQYNRARTDVIATELR